MGTNGFPQNSTTYYMFTRILDELPGKIKSVKILEGLFFSIKMGKSDVRKVGFQMIPNALRKIIMQKPVLKV